MAADSSPDHLSTGKKAKVGRSACFQSNNDFVENTALRNSLKISYRAKIAVKSSQDSSGKKDERD